MDGRQIYHIESALEGTALKTHIRSFSGDVPVPTNTRSLMLRAAVSDVFVPALGSADNLATLRRKTDPETVQMLAIVTIASAPDTVPTPIAIAGRQTRSTAALQAWATVPEGAVSVPRQEHRAATDLDP